MAYQKNSQPSSNLPSFAEALAAAEQMQQDWLEHGVNFVELYVEDVDGNWLEAWGTDEPAENGSVSSDGASSERSVEHDLFIQSIVTFLMSNDPVALAARPYWESRSIAEIASHLEHCFAFPEAERSYAVQDLLAHRSINSVNYRNVENGNKKVNVLELAENLLIKLTEVLHPDE